MADREDLDDPGSPSDGVDDAVSPHPELPQALEIALQGLAQLRLEGQPTQGPLHRELYVGGEVPQHFRLARPWSEAHLAGAAASELDPRWSRSILVAAVSWAALVLLGLLVRLLRPAGSPP